MRQRWFGSLGSVFLWWGVLGGFAAFGHDFDVKVGGVDGEEVLRLAHDLHEVIEGEDADHTFLEAFLRKINFKRTVINTVRYHHQNAEKNRDHIANMMLLFPTSHLAETVSGPIYFAWAGAAGVSPAVMIPVGSFLTSLAVPGIDWVCIILYGTYLGSEDFRGAVRGARIFGVKAAQLGAKSIGLDEILKALIQKVPAEERIREKLEAAPFLEALSEPANEFEIAMRGNVSGEEEVPFAKLRMAPFANELSLNSIVFPYADLEKYNRWPLWWEMWRSIKHLGWNVQDALLYTLGRMKNDKLYSALADPNIARVHIHYPGEGEFTFERQGHHCHGCDHDHDHEVSLVKTPVERGLAPGEVEFEFVEGAIRYRDSIKLDWLGADVAWQLWPNYMGDRYSKFFSSVPGGFVQGANAIPGVSVRVIGGIPTVFYKGFKIFKEAGWNTLKAMGTILKTGVKALNSCGLYLVRRAKGEKPAPKPHVPLPSWNDSVP